MAYSELIKNFERVREYMRQFYVYGFKSRSEYTVKSARSYDNERRRVESWLGDYMSFSRQEGKRIFMSVDSRSAAHNPLYAAFGAKSFTAGDITFHFYILDMLADGKELTFGEILRQMEEYLSCFECAEMPDESSVRKKLGEYVALGLLQAQKRGRQLFYRRAADIDLHPLRQALSFYSEADPLGVIGSFLCEEQESPFRFRDHYILHTLDAQILCTLLSAIAEGRQTELSVDHYRKRRSHRVLPLKIMVSTGGGRQYVLAYGYQLKRFMFFRLDTIVSVRVGEAEADIDKYRARYQDFKKYQWGVSADTDFSLQHIEMTIGTEDEGVIQRLYREKRCGWVEQLDEHTYRYTADVYDAGELLPWLRTFIGQIERLYCSDSKICDTFYRDLECMAQLYGGDENDL